jgi:hypothetical protein
MIYVLFTLLPVFFIFCMIWPALWLVVLALIILYVLIVNNILY